MADVAVPLQQWYLVSIERAQRVYLQVMDRAAAGKDKPCFRFELNKTLCALASYYCAPFSVCMCRSACELLVAVGLTVCCTCRWQIESDPKFFAMGMYY